MILLEFYVSPSYQHAVAVDPDGLFYLVGEFFLYMCADGPGRATGIDGLRGGFDVGDYAVDPVGFGMTAVIAQFELNVEEDQEEGGHSHGEAQDVDEGEYAVTPEIAEGDLEIVFDHLSRIFGCFGPGWIRRRMDGLVWIRFWVIGLIRCE